MTAFVGDIRSFWQGIRYRAVQVLRHIRRTRPGPAVVRLIAMSAAASALALAAPHSVLTSSQAGLLVPFALGVGLFPRTGWVSVTLLIAVALWMLDTIVQATEEPLWRVGLLAASLYVAHAAAALAAALPYDAAAGSAMLVRWCARLAAVTTISVGLGLAGMAVLTRLPAERGIIGPIVGSAVAAGLVGVLAWQLRRR